MLNVVYVLVSQEKDYFYEQMLLSMTSLRYVMREVTITLVLEQNTQKYLQEKHREIEEFVDRIEICQISDTYSPAAKSRILKTKMREVVEGDFLYLDCDTVVCESLADIQNYKKSGAVLDNHGIVEKNIYEFDGAIKRAEAMGFSVGYECKHFNCGVLWCKDDEETRNFFKEWNKVWHETFQKGFLQDQLSFNEINARRGGIFNELDGIWNCQIRYGIPYLAEAKVIHYFASNQGKGNERKFAYQLTSYDIYKRIRENGFMQDDMKQMIYHPRTAFMRAVLVEAGSVNYHIFHSHYMALLRGVYKKMPKLFQAGNWLLGKIHGL